MHGVGGKLLFKAVQNFYVDSRSCVQEMVWVSGFRTILDCDLAV